MPTFSICVHLSTWEPWCKLLSAIWPTPTHLDSNWPAYTFLSNISTKKDGKRQCLLDSRISKSIYFHLFKRPLTIAGMYVAPIYISIWTRMYQKLWKVPKNTGRTRIWYSIKMWMLFPDQNLPSHQVSQLAPQVSAVVAFSPSLLSDILWFVCKCLSTCVLSLC